MNKYNTAIAVAVVSTMLLSALFLTAPGFSLANLELPTFNVAFAQAAENVVELEAEVLPNGQYGYRMVSHEVDGDDVTDKYDTQATIPGPTIVINEGESLDLEISSDIPGVEEDFEVEGFDFGAAETGTYIYKGEEGALLGLFGAIVVNAADGTVESHVNGGNGEITQTEASGIEKELVLFMVGSTFWGMEIDVDGNQTPLWTNPVIAAVEGDLVRFHILSVGPGHTFHLHAHRWVDPGTSTIIDTKLMEPGQDVHVFTVEAGDEVGPGDWQYHCHVFAHMEAGMHGLFRVVESGDADSVPGANPYNGLLTGGEGPGLVTFEITDEPGRWFRSPRGAALEGITVTRSLELARPGDSVQFIMSETDTVHTITSLLWPTGADHMPMDEVQSYKGGGIVELTDAGLYVFTCKVHPYMFGGVIVDDPETTLEVVGGVPTDAALPAPFDSLLGNIAEPDGDNGLLLDLGQTISLVNGYQIPTGSDLALRLAKTFFVATTQDNWRDYSQASWNPSYPAVPVKASVYLGDLNGGGLNNDDNFLPVAVKSLDVLLEVYFDEGAVTNSLSDPGDEGIAGVGEVWVNTQFEETESKSKPGTATAVDTTDWEVNKKVALPDFNMNNPHNMWTDRDQSVIYQTEWFSNKLSTFDRETGEPISQIVVGEAPSHVMTRADTDDIHVALNGEEGVAEILATTEPEEVERIIAMQGFGQNPTHPHAHWMSSDGQKMVTPNSFTHDSSLYGFDTESIESKTATGVLPIATGMKPDDSYYVVANLLSSTVSVLDLSNGDNVRNINLLGDYNPVILRLVNDDGGLLDVLLGISLGQLATTSVAALPIQTPISPDGKYMVTANTLTGNIIVTDVSSSNPDDWEIVADLPCDPGCHGAQFGAKEGGGYLAYVSSKFANDLIVIDIDEESDTHLEIVGRILLNPTGGMDVYDDEVEDLDGYGGQGVLAIPNVYNGWVQNLDEDDWTDLTEEQRNPIAEEE